MAEVNKKIDAIRSELRSEIEPLKSNIDGLTKKLEQVEKSQEFIAKKYDSVLTTVSEIKKASSDLDQLTNRMAKKFDALYDDYSFNLRLDELEQ
jgi:uncharacterized coiled-coil DUF342 family protein